MERTSKRQKNLTHKPQERGFAMVATMTLMVLMSLLAIAMLDLTRIELRNSAEARYRPEARANARLALMMALGELQRTLGPDQRISAPSSILDQNPDTEEIDGVENPHWVRVWSTTREDGLPFIQRVADDGGLQDTRVSEEWEAEDESLAILVSGQEALLTNGSEEDSVTTRSLTPLVSTGTLGTDADDSQIVHAPLVAVRDPEDASSTPSKSNPTNTKGAYAWWVGDLNTKANVATPDFFNDNASEVSQLRQIQLSQDASLTSLEGASELDNAVRSRLISRKQLELVAGAEDLSPGQYFHDFTVQSQSVLANAREGGLQKDLTAYLLSEGTIEPNGDESDLTQLGLQDEDNLFGPRNETEAGLLVDGAEASRLERVSPTFALLRDWSRQASSHPLGDLTAATVNAETRNPESDIFSYGNHNQQPAKYFQRRQNDLSPILVEGSTYYNISAYETGEAAPQAWGLRLHLYPRVTLWNPYNFDLEVPSSMIALQINGGKQIEVTFDPPAVFSIADRFGGLEEVEIESTRYDMSWGNLTGTSGSFERWRRGSHYFQLEEVTIPPGETVVFSPVSNSVYNESTFSENVLSASVPPSPTRSFFLDERSDGDPLFEIEVPIYPEPRGVFANNYIIEKPTGWREFVDTEPLGNIQTAGYTQADDYYMYWKPNDGSAGSAINLDRFNSLPHGQFVSCAYQYGDEDELPVEWSESYPVPMALSSSSGVVSTTPDRRTRDGFRLRWFDEHLSNRYGGGSLAGSAHLESSLVGNWNLRSSYSFRSPFENISDVAPHFFSGYTRDLFDGDVSWEGMSPSQRGGMNIGDPFNPPVAGTTPRILFDVPRSETGIQSLGAFQHVKFSEFTWHPTYALGNSIADPRMPLDRTEPRRDSTLNSRQGGWNKDSIGWSDDGRSNSNNGEVSNEENWARHARGLLEENVEDNTVMFDLSFELNHSLWDRYFLSTGDEEEKRAFASQGTESPLPNGRLRLLDSLSSQPEEDLLDYHRAASVLLNDGGFNVNSTSVAAWEAMLLSTVGTQFGDDRVAFPRILDSSLETFDGKAADSAEAWAGTRTLDRDEVKRLAEEIVEQVKTRGPFLSLSDFVNRKLTTEDEGLKGCLQAAIDQAGINGDFEATYPLDNSESLPNFNHPDNIEEPTRIEQTHKPSTTAWGAMGFLTQADLLQSLGHTFFVRSDSFVIRTYGEAHDKNGKVTAQAWCEAVVQRTPEPIIADATGLNPLLDDDSQGFGRRFVVQSFRWLSKDEV